MTRNRLPEKFSKVLRLALADEAEVHRSENLHIDMDVWHLPDDKGGCVMCLAGAYMHRHLDVDVGGSVTPTNLCFSTEQRKALFDLDDARKYWWHKIAQGYPDILDALLELDKIEYEDDRLGWRKQMFKAARILEEAGL